MSLAIVYTRAQCGIDAPLVTVETHLSNGLPCLSIVGLPETAVKESKDRVRSALINSHFEFPSRRITINLAPADLPKEGGRFDLAIALGILAASGQIPEQALQGCEFLGELALTGELRAVKGVLPAALKATAQQRQLVVPQDNADEASLSSQASILAADHLLTLCAHLHGREQISPYQRTAISAAENLPDLADVRGQPQAKRALEIAATGNHNLLMVGPPGTGKTMLASRLAGILPPLSEAEALEYAAVQSVVHGAIERDWQKRPFRAPHHTASAVALVGGGNPPRPGEISLSHHGVLFLDELPEYPRAVLEVLREPLESGEIVISRASQKIAFPARFQLIAAMNPCPCGYYGDSHSAGSYSGGNDLRKDSQRNCRCTPDQVRRYRSKISGPLLDRIDMHLQVNAIPVSMLMDTATRAEEASATVRERVVTARARQQQRQGKPNHQLSGREIQAHCPLNKADQQVLENAIERLKLSARAYHRILKVSRTIADLDGAEQISTTQLREALGYRALDREII